jgi:hypothetical protein
MSCIAEPITSPHGLRYSLCGWPENGRAMLSTLAEAEALNAREHVCQDCLKVARRSAPKQPDPL